MTSGLIFTLLGGTLATMAMLSDEISWKYCLAISIAALIGAFADWSEKENKWNEISAGLAALLIILISEKIWGANLSWSTQIFIVLGIVFFVIGLGRILKAKILNNSKS